MKTLFAACALFTLSFTAYAGLETTPYCTTDDSCCDGLGGRSCDYYCDRGHSCQMKKMGDACVGQGAQCSSANECCDTLTCDIDSICR